MRRAMPVLVLTLAMMPIATSVHAQEAGPVVDELRRLNGAVERLTVLMERLVDERRVEALQRQLAIENERVTPLEARAASVRKAILALRDEDAELVQRRAELARQQDDLSESLVRSVLRPKIDRIDARRAEIQAQLAERERELRDAEAESVGLRARMDRLSGEIDVRLGLGD